MTPEDLERIKGQKIKIELAKKYDMREFVMNKLVH